MSKIKKIDINDGSICVILNSGVCLSRSFSDNVLNVFKSSMNKLIGVEIFDLEIIDNIIVNLGDRDSVFSVSKFFLELGALEMGKPLYRYIGDGDIIPKIYSNEEYSIFDIDRCFTITGIIDSLVDSNYKVLYSNDLIVCDLAIGLSIPFIKTNNKEVVDRLSCFLF